MMMHRFGCSDALKDLPSYDEFARITSERIHWAQEILYPFHELEDSTSSSELVNSHNNVVELICFTGDYSVIVWDDDTYRSKENDTGTTEISLVQNFTDEFNHMELFSTLEKQAEQEATLELASINSRYIANVEFQAFLSKTLQERSDRYRMHSRMSWFHSPSSRCTTVASPIPDTRFILFNEHKNTAKPETLHHMNQYKLLDRDQPGTNRYDNNSRNLLRRHNHEELSAIQLNIGCCFVCSLLLYERDEYNKYCIFRVDGFNKARCQIIIRLDGEFLNFSANNQNDKRQSFLMGQLIYHFSIRNTGRLCCFIFSMRSVFQNSSISVLGSLRSSVMIDRTSVPYVSRNRLMQRQAHNLPLAFHHSVKDSHGSKKTGRSTLCIQKIGTESYFQSAPKVGEPYTKFLDLISFPHVSTFRVEAFHRETIMRLHLSNKEALELWKYNKIPSIQSRVYYPTINKENKNLQLSEEVTYTEVIRCLCSLQKYTRHYIFYITADHTSKAKACQLIQDLYRKSKLKQMPRKEALKEFPDRQNERENKKIPAIQLRVDSPTINKENKNLQPSDGVTYTQVISCLCSLQKYTRHYHTSKAKACQLIQDLYRKSKLKKRLKDLRKCSFFSHSDFPEGSWDMDLDEFLGSVENLIHDVDEDYISKTPHVQIKIDPVAMYDDTDNSSKPENGQVVHNNTLTGASIQIGDIGPDNKSKSQINLREIMGEWNVTNITLAKNIIKRKNRINKNNQKRIRRNWKS